MSTSFFHDFIGAEFGSSNSMTVNEEDFEIAENWDIELSMAMFLKEILSIMIVGHSL